ncbi:MAG: hypothetical protein ACPGU7_14495, partial [Gammaproteobacteria bacterium]
INRNYSTLECDSTFVKVSTSTAYGADYHCEGKIDRVIVGGDGQVSIISAELYGSSDDTSGRSLCNLETAWNGIGTKTCSAWLSSVLTWIARSSTVRVAYQGSAVSSCAAQGTWTGAEAPSSLWNVN